MLRLLTRKAVCLEIKRVVWCTRKSFCAPLSIPCLRPHYIIFSRENSDYSSKSNTTNFQIIEEESEELFLPENLKLEVNGCAQTKELQSTYSQSSQNESTNLVGSSSTIKECKLGSHVEIQAVGSSDLDLETINTGNNQGKGHHKKKRGRKPKFQTVEQSGSSTNIDNGTIVETSAQPKKRGPKPKSQKVEHSASLGSIDDGTIVETSAQPKKRGPKLKFQKAVQTGSSNIGDRSIDIEILGQKIDKKVREKGIDSGIAPVEERAWNTLRKSDTESDYGIPCVEEAPIKTKSDLIKYLSTISNPKRGAKKLLLENRKYDVTNRVNIIDSKLCDEALQRLAPSLEKHKGCDIIDLNPGVGVWSSKLHGLLQPRSHILMEPHPNSYIPALKPLLDAPSSKYQIVPENGMSWAHLEKILSPKYLPFQPILKHGDPELERPNNTLLVTANISDYHSRRFLGFGSVGSVVIYQFLSAIRSHALFQHYGKVRMLLWMNSDDTRVIPRNLAGQKKTAMEALVTCDHIETVVDSDENKRHCSREKRLDIERVRSVVENMKRKGVEIPKGRETHILKDLRSGATGSEIEELSPKSLQKSLQQMNESFARGDFEKNCLPEEDSYNELLDSKRRKLPKKTPEYERMRELARRNKRRVSKTQRLSDLADDYGDILALYRQSYLTKCPTESQALQIQARSQTNIWRENLSTLPPADSAEIQYICDSRRSYSQDPPGMFWDRREFEPLRASPDDFYPNKTLSLLDFRPVLTPFFSENPAYQDIISYLIMQLCLVPSQNLKQALDSLAPGALEWLIAECPSLTDPLKNGCPDLELFSARCITVEMLTEMTKAWLRWPFRPHRDEILHRLGSEAFSDQTEPE
ncbi:BgTH12-01578 [Blumeria graminis f. sp. triticale]|nr:BgTH12-01578 [Blumeria graminis f. sp. triticale]